METSGWQIPGRIMEDLSGGEHRRGETRRPGLGFPLGTAFVLLIVLGISALFSICYHWEKIRSFHGRHRNLSFPDASTQHVRANLPLQMDAGSTSSSKNLDIQQRRSLPVVMPGDEMPKFIAWPSPYLQENDLQT